MNSSDVKTIASPNVLDEGWLKALQLYEKYGLWISIVFAILGLLAAIELYRFLRYRRGFWAALLEAVIEGLFWFPGRSTVDEYKDAEEKRKAFLEKRRQRKPGNLTDDI